MKIKAAVLYAMDAKPPFAFDLLNEVKAVRQVVVFH
jgi:hypothetical protein